MLVTGRQQTFSRLYLPGRSTITIIYRFSRVQTIYFNNNDGNNFNFIWRGENSPMYQNY